MLLVMCYKYVDTDAFSQHPVKLIAKLHFQSH